MRVLTYLVAGVAILIGIFLSSIPSQLGFYRWLASLDPSLVSWWTSTTVVHSEMRILADISSLLIAAFVMAAGRIVTGIPPWDTMAIYL